MPEFSPGESKTAVVTMSNPTSKAFDYSAELYMGTNLALMASTSFHLEAEGSKDISLPVTMPSDAGTYPVYIGVFSGGEFIEPLYKAEDVVIKTVTPQATITSVKLNKTTIRQGDDLIVTANIKSNFAGGVWTVFAHGQGTPSSGAGFRPLYNAGGDYLGWFPSGFDFVRYNMYTTSVDVRGMELKVGDNVRTVIFSLDRKLPPGTYTIYVAVMPPAANWYQWDDPYDWTVSQPFTVLEEGPQITVTEPLVTERVSCAGGWLHRDGFAHGSGADIGLFSAKRNRLCFNVLSWEGACVERDYYMEFINPTAGEHITHPHYPDCWLLSVSRLAMGIMVRSSPPETPYGYPAKYYDVEITGWLTYPDGHTEQKSTVDKTPVAERDYRKENFHIVPLGPGTYRRFEGLYDGGIDQPMPKGKYTLRLRLVCEGIVFCDETKSFTII